MLREPQKLNILLIFQEHKENFVYVFIMMKARVFYLLMSQKYIHSKQKTLK